MPPNARCAELHSGGSRGSSPAPIAAANAPRSCSRSFKPASSITLIRRLGLPTCWHGSLITRSTIWPRCFPGICESRCQVAPKRREPRAHVKSTGFSAAEKSAVTSACQNLIDDFLKPRFLPVIRPTQFNYPIDILGKWHGTISLHSTLPLRLPGESRRRVRRPLRPPRLDQPQPLRHPVAPSHRRMVLPASRPYPCRSDRQAKVRWIAPSPLNTASRLPRGTRRMGTNPEKLLQQQRSGLGAA